jgi:predicted GNAT family acetyltransferase
MPEDRIAHDATTALASLTVRVATEADADSIAKLLGLAYRLEPAVFSITPEEFAVGIGRVHVNPLNAWFIVVVDERVVACAQLAMRCESRLQHKAELRRVFVHPQYRGKGIATATIDYLLRARPGHVKFVRLYVNVNNGAAIRLYERLGFATYAIEPFAKAIGSQYVDEAIMQINLTQSDKQSRSS